MAPLQTPTTRLVVVLTAGGTREPIDDVRHLSNVASGGLPAAMAEALLARGAEVHYVHGPGAVKPARLSLDVALDGPSAPDEAALDEALAAFRQQALESRSAWAQGQLICHPVTSAADAAQTVAQVVSTQRPHLVACAMAVADFAPVPHRGKLSSQQGGDGGLTLHLQATAKVIDGVLAAWPDAALLGFKLLSGATEDEHRQASTALARRSGARWVFSNDMADYGQGLRRGKLWSAEGHVLQHLDGGSGDRGRRELADQIVASVLGYLEGAG